MQYQLLKIVLLFIFLSVFILPGCSKDSVNEPEENVTYISPDNVHQVIRGFGAANILPWRPDMKLDEINKAFGTGEGHIGFSLLRIRIPSDPNEFNLNVPTAKLAHSLGVTIIASPWSPPAALKTNKNIIGGRLNDTSYASYATHLKSFVDYMASNGIPVYAVSIQNEPDINVNYESCDWSAAEIQRFLKENALSVGTKIIAPESYQFRRQLSDPILNDPAAATNFDILGGHIYGGGLAPYPLAETKGKEIWMTEHLETSSEWADNLATGKEILDCMNAGMNAYIWWYIVRFYGPIYDDGSHPDTPHGAVPGEISKRGYVMSQFARFVRPGYERIGATENPQSNVFVTAFKAGTKIVIVALNNNSSSIEQKFEIQSGTVSKFIPYVTSETKNCSQDNRINVSDKSFTVHFEASSITTLVSE